MKKALTLLLAALIVLSLAACGGTAPAAEKEQSAAEVEQAEPETVEETEATAAEEAPENTPEPTDTPVNEDVKSREILDASIKLVVASVWGENYEIDIDGDTYMISTWMDGLAMDAYAAQSGDEEILDAWNTILSNCASQCEDIQSTYADNGYDIVVGWNILNDLNKENTLATVMSFGTVYDFVNDIDLIG